MRIIIEIDEESRGSSRASGIRVSHGEPDVAAARGDAESIDGGPAPSVETDFDATADANAPQSHDVEDAGAAPAFGEGGA